MPVIDLADYLGMPVQAPANPVFNQTRKSTGVASLDREVEDFYKGAAAIDQLNRLQRQAPVLQAQQAQMAYDKVVQEARDLRMKQEIATQVEQSITMLAAINPAAEDFLARRQEYMAKYPLAMMDERVKELLHLNGIEHERHTQQRASEQRASEQRTMQAQKPPPQSQPPTRLGTPEVRLASAAGNSPRVTQGTTADRPNQSDELTRAINTISEAFEAPSLAAQPNRLGGHETKKTYSQVSSRLIPNAPNQVAVQYLTSDVLVWILLSIIGLLLVRLIWERNKCMPINRLATLDSVNEQRPPTLIREVYNKAAMVLGGAIGLGIGIAIVAIVLLVLVGIFDGSGTTHYEDPWNEEPMLSPR